MAKKVFEHKTFNVAVIGLSGTEKEKGVTGIGKSCFCNRFVRPHEDEYSTNHISVISQTDFGGLIVNNDHFLYWGDVNRTTDDGVDITFHVVEQTEFIDDSSFQPFKSGKSDPYYKRCANPKLQSSEKLMYICKDQLGLEHEFDEKYLPEGRLSIDGFLCLFDVSQVPKRPPDRQTDYVVHILNSVLKTKKPVILVTTKQDESCDNQMREVDRLLSKKELNKAGLLVIDSSAQENINIESAFLTLAQLMDKTVKTRPKVTSYADASRAMQERKQVANEAFWSLMRSQVTEYKSTWSLVYRKLKDFDDYRTYIELYGTNTAKKLHRKHVAHLRDECVRERMERYLESLKALLQLLLPDLDVIADRSWPSIQRWLDRQEFFHDYFVRIPDGLPWQKSEIIEGKDQRIPFDLLDSSEAEKVYRNHVNALRAEFKRADLKRQFKQLLEESNNVRPGKPLGDVTIFFVGRECFTSLSEEDKAEVYAQHEQELRNKAKEEFLELLLEKAELFFQFEYQVNTEGLREIDECLKTEPRCMALRCIPDERKAILLQHLGFIQSPSKDKCPFRKKCVDIEVERILSTKARRPQSWGRSTEFLLEAEDNRINLVLLGSMGLADQLAHEIRLQCVDDEYTLDGQIYSLDYRPIDSDVTLPQNSFKTQDFTPHGCFCVFNSLDTLDFIQDSLEKTLLSDLQRDDRLPFQGLPIVIVLAFDPYISDKQLLHLREEGQALADRLQCPFIDVPSSMMVDASKRFHGDQISLAMFSLVQSIKHRSSFVNPWQIAESIEPDIRVLMCFMCADSFNMEFPLAPLLNHQCCYVTNLDKFPTITLETYLDDSKRKVEVTVASYHGANQVRDELFHGYILVYSAKRLASLANLSAFASVINVAPTKVLAVTEGGSANAFFSNEHEQVMITEGNALADSLHGASFMTTPINFKTQTASYTPFFKECWDKKADTESAFSFNDDTSLTSSQKNEKWIIERLSTRPPVPLPNHANTNHVRKESFTTFGKGSTSNSQSTEDSEPIYDRPHNQFCQSDSEDNNPLHSCDTSPYASVPIADYHHNSGRLYSDVTTSNNNNNHQYHHHHHHQQSSHVFKGQRSDKFRNSYPSASNPIRSYAIETTFPVHKPKQPLMAVPPVVPPPPQLPMTATLPERKRPGTPPFPLVVGDEGGLPIYDDRNPLSSNSSMTQSMIEDYEPRYQFRKSNSMKLALNESDEASPWLIDDSLSPGSSATLTSTATTTRNRTRRLVKQFTMPALKCRECHTLVRGATLTPPAYHRPSGFLDTLGLDDKKAPPTYPKPGKTGLPQGRRASPGQLDFCRYNDVRHVINRNIKYTGGQQQQSLLVANSKAAPLATPEHEIEINNDYAIVKDCLISNENEYAEVVDALPGGQVHRIRSTKASKGHAGVESTTDSEFSSLERDGKCETIYTRVNRKPTPHKKKGKSRNPESSLPPPPPPPPPPQGYVVDRFFAPLHDNVDKLRSNSPSEGSEGTGDEVHGTKKLKKRRSFKKKKDNKDFKDTTPLVGSGGEPTLLTQSDLAGSNLNMAFIEDESSMTSLDPVSPRPDGEEDPNDSSKWKNMLSLGKFIPDPEKQRRKKIIKEEERKMKEQQKAQKKMNKKKDSKSSLNTSSINNLEDLAQSEDNLIPGFVELCVAFIEKEGLASEGIYRVPGNKAQVELLIEKFKEDETAEIRSLDIPVNAVATGLKQFFNELTEPLIPTRLHEELTEASGIKEKTTRLIAVRGLVMKLPLCNFEVLKYLVSHIHKVSEYCTENKMSIENLAVCWWPTLLRPEFKDFESMSLVSKYLEDVVKLIIEQYRFIFYNDDEV